MCRWLLAATMSTAIFIACSTSFAKDEHATDGAHGDHHAHIGMPDSKESKDPSELKGDLAIYTFVVFVLLMLILRKFAWGPIAQALDAREQKIADDLHAAQHSHAEAKRLLAEYETKLAAAHDEVRAIVDQGKKDAQHLQEELMAKARAEAAAEMTRATREIGLARDAALQELATSAANLAVDLAGKIVHSKLNAADHASLVKEAVDTFVSRN